MRNFFIVLMIFGMTVSTAQWFMYRTAFATLAKTWTLVFFILPPIVFSLVNGCVNALPVFLIRGLAWVSGLWFAFFYYSTILLLLYMLAFVAGKIGDFGQMVHYLPRIGLFLILFIVVVGWWRAGHRVYREEIYATNKSLGQNLTIAFVSDIHLGALYGADSAISMVNMINEVNPDLVLLGGDIIDGDLSFVIKENSLAALENIHAPLGVYAVYGNHDVMRGTAEEEGELLKTFGVHMVMNNQVKVGKNIILTGLDDFMRSANSYDFPSAEEDKLNIFMEHQPRSINKAATKGYDLYFAGHTHAGQFYPNREMTKRMYVLDYGSELFGKMLATVSCGYGLWGIPIRIGPAPEIVVVKVQRRS